MLYPVVSYDREHGFDMDCVREFSNFNSFKICGPFVDEAHGAKVVKGYAHAACLLSCTWKEMVKTVFPANVVIDDLAFIIIMCHGGDFGSSYSSLVDADYNHRLVLIGRFPTDQIEWWWTVKLYSVSTVVGSPYHFTLPLFVGQRQDRHKLVWGFNISVPPSCEWFAENVWTAAYSQHKFILSAQDMQRAFDRSDEAIQLGITPAIPELLENLSTETCIGRHLCLERRSTGANGLDISWSHYTDRFIPANGYAIFWHSLPIKMTENWGDVCFEWPDMFVARSSTIRANLRVHWLPARIKDTVRDTYVNFWIIIKNETDTPYYLEGGEDTRLYQFVIPPSITWSEQRKRHRQPPNQDYEMPPNADTCGFYTKNCARKAKY